MSRDENLAILRETVAQYGQPPAMANFLSRIMRAESSGDIYAKNRNSTATGLFQFIKSTWEAYGQGANIYDPRAQCDAVVRFTMDNARVLRSTLGREPNEGEYYLAHFAGPQGARSVLTAHRDVPISRLLEPKALAANADISFRGKSFGDFTASDLTDWADARMKLDMDARASYALRRHQRKTTKEEDAKELETRRRNLEAFGVGKEALDKLGLGLLGDIFFAIIKFFMDMSAPASERNENGRSREDSQIAMRNVSSTKIARAGALSQA